MNALEKLVKKARNDFEMTLMDVMLDPQDEENTCYLINDNQMKKLRKSFNALAEVIKEMENTK